MGFIGIAFIFAVIGAAFDWRYKRKGGKRSSKESKIMFLVAIGLVAALYATLIFLGTSAGSIGYITPPILAVLFTLWELGRWRVRSKNPLPKAPATGLTGAV